MAVPAHRAEPHPLIIDAYLQVLLEQAASDVAVLIAKEGTPIELGPDSSVLVPFGGAEHDWAGPERIGAGRAPRLREGGLSAADTATGRGTPENDLQGPEAAPRSRGPGRADDAR